MSLHHPPPPGIDTVEQLHAHLQYALEVEHSTIPVYLSALFSMQPNTNLELAALLRSVVVDEMLHMVLVANVLNAIGGTPQLTSRQFLPAYPATLPMSDGSVEMRLGALTPSAVEMFLAIERPAAIGATPQADRYHTLGQFYAALEDGLTRIAATQPALFSGPRERQIPPNTYMYGSLRDTVEVTDLASALTALSVITAQGEGYDSGIHQGDVKLHDPDGLLAHYYRFEEVARARRYRRSDTRLTGPTGEAVRVDWSAVYPVRHDPHRDDLAPGATRDFTDQANKAYGRLLRTLEDGLTGRPDALLEAVVVMHLVGNLGRMLAKIPTGNGADTAGMTFEALFD